MTIDRVFKHGTTVYVKTADGWRTESFKAYIQPIRYKNKVYLEGDFTEIGVNGNDMYLYLGPSKHDLSVDTKELRVVDYSNSRVFSVDKAEKVYFDGKVFYIWAVLRLNKEASYGNNFGNM